MEEINYVWSENQKALIDGLIAERNAAQAELAQLRAQLNAAKLESASNDMRADMYEQKLDAANKRAEHAEMLLKMWIAKMYPSNETEWQFGSTYISDDLAILTRAALEAKQ